MKLLKFIALSASALALAACSSSDPDPLPEPVAPAIVQVLHASSDAPAVDVLVNGGAALTDFDYKQGSGYIELDPAQYEFEVQAIVPGDNVPVIGGVGNEVIRTLDSDIIYTVVALNDAAAIEPVIVAQPNTAVAAGNVELTVLHAAPAVDPVDVYVSTVDADLSTVTPITLAFKGDSIPTEVPAGEYQIRVTLEGDDVVQFDSGPVDLPADTRLFVAAVPSTTGDASLISLTVLTSAGSFEILDVEESARVRAVHNAADVPPVDIVADGGVVFGDRSFPFETEFVEVPGGTYTIEVATAGDYPAGVAIGPVDLDFATGTFNTVIARGTLTNGDLNASQLTEDPRPVALYSKVRIFHGASTAPAVDIYLVEPGSTDLTTGLGRVVSGLDYAQSTDFASIPAGTYDAIVTVAGTETIAIGPAALPALENGGVYNVIARDPVEIGSADFGLTVYVE